MLIVTNLAGTTEPIIDYLPPARTRNVDGEHTLTVTVQRTKNNSKSFPLLVNESIVECAGIEYIIKDIDRRSVGDNPVVTFTALHRFFEIVDTQVDETISGVTTLTQALDHALNKTEYGFTIEGEFPKVTLDEFGRGNALKLFNECREKWQFEFEVKGNLVTIKKKIGTETDEQIRWKHNLKTLKEQVNTNNLSTRIRGYGKKDEETGEYLVTAEYISPNEHLYPKPRYAPSVYDERFTDYNSLYNYIASKLIDEPECSYTVEYAALKRAGAKQLKLGDRAFLIHEVLNLDFYTRVTEITDFPLTPSATPIYTIANRAFTMTEEIAKNDKDKGLQEIIDKVKNAGWKLREELDAVIQAMAEVDAAMVNVKQEMARIENEVVPEIEQAVKESTIPRQPTPPDHNEHKLWMDTSQNPPRFMQWKADEGKWVPVAPVDAQELEQIKQEILDQVDSDIKDQIKGVKEAIYTGTTPPPNIAQLWLDISIDPAVLKRFKEGEWVSIGSVTLEELGGVDKGTYEKDMIRVTDSEAEILRLSDQISLKVEQKQYDIDLKNMKSEMNVLSSEIELLPGKLNLMVQKNGVISSINLSPETIKIQAPRIDIQGVVNFINNDGTIGTMINGRKIITGSLTADQLNVNNIFGNSAVIAKIQSDSVKTASLDATKIVTGVLNADRVSIVNLSASSIITGTLDASRVRVANLDASEIKTGKLSAMRIGAGEIEGVTIKTSSYSNDYIHMMNQNLEFWNNRLKKMEMGFYRMLDGEQIPHIIMGAGTSVGFGAGTFRLIKFYDEANLRYVSTNGQNRSEIVFSDYGNIIMNMNNQRQHVFYNDGRKIGGSITIEDDTWGMSPIDSPQVLIEYIMFDVSLTDEWTLITVDELFVKATENIAIFPSNGEVKKNGRGSFFIRGKGVADVRLVGVRKGSNDTFWVNMSEVEV
ncbi:phage tail spike protein [Pseudobacillus badius]|uniref:phage tail spike protein n=1 Tax=Bacillus badius TaxID=1455 RepID=UPI0007B3CCF9|nr:phage tail spike protein [Bacillus badius]KZR58366.1 hypothetical protein A3781_17380 [Bacillus badius]